ncbi:hypothetical protein cyc_02819 [Cyclospora cayetanensis]|uniref:Uncharacterized protein n=1 Tax=Cyclospora cayetanensis TaxID=88456 RepID=A0A1D3DAX4_9EIME|nr:hypothetical protein cyc_02819 [Cyclospora cayetanensis]
MRQQDLLGLLDRGRKVSWPRNSHALNLLPSVTRQTGPQEHHNKVQRLQQQAEQEPRQRYSLSQSRIRSVSGVTRQVWIASIPT